MHKKVRKKIIHHRFQKNKDSLSELISTGAYKRKLTDLAKNNKSLALALQHARCELSTQREILKDYMENCNKVRLAKIKLKNMVSTVQILVADLDEISQLLDVNMTEKHQQCIKVMQKNNSPDCGVRMKLWDPAVSCIEEASASWIDPDVATEEEAVQQNSTNIVPERDVCLGSSSNEQTFQSHAQVENKDSDSVLEKIFHVHLNSVTPILFVDDSNELDDSEYNKGKENGHTTYADIEPQMSFTPEFDDYKNEKSNEQRVGQSFHRLSKKDIGERKNSAKRTEPLATNTCASEEVACFDENQNEMGRYDSKIILTPELVLPACSRKKSSCSKKVQNVQRSSKRKNSSNKSLGKMSEFSSEKNMSEMRNNSTAENGDDYGKQKMKVSLSAELKDVDFKELSVKKEVLSERDRSKKMKNSNSTVNALMEHVVTSQIDSNLCDKMETTFEKSSIEKKMKVCEKNQIHGTSENASIKSALNLQNKTVIEKIVKEPLKPEFCVKNDLGIPNQTILISEDMELTEIIPIPKLTNQNNKLLFAENNHHIQDEALLKTSSSNVQTDSNALTLVSESSKTKFCGSNLTELIQESVNKCSQVMLHSSHGEELKETINDQSSSPSEQYSSPKECPETVRRKSRLSRKGSRLTESSRPMQNEVHAMEHISDYSIDQTITGNDILFSKTEIVAPVSEVSVADDDVNEKIPSKSTIALENQDLKTLDSASRTPTTTCRRSARVKKTPQYALFFQSPDASFSNEKNKKRKLHSEVDDPREKKQKCSVSECKAKNLDMHDIDSNLLKKDIYDLNLSESSPVTLNSKSNNVIENVDKNLFSKSCKKSSKALKSTPQSSKIKKTVNQDLEPCAEAKSTMTDCVRKEKNSFDNLSSFHKRNVFNPKLSSFINENENLNKLKGSKTQHRASCGLENDIQVQTAPRQRSVSFAPIDLICNFEKFSFAKDISDQGKTKCLSKSIFDFDIDLNTLKKRNQQKQKLQRLKCDNSVPCEKQNSNNFISNEKIIEAKINISNLNKLVPSTLDAESHNMPCLENHVSSTKSQFSSEQNSCKGNTKPNDNQALKDKKSEKEKSSCQNNNLENSIHFNEEDFFADTEVYTFIPVEGNHVKQFDTAEKTSCKIPDVPEKVNKKQISRLKTAKNDIIVEHFDSEQCQEMCKQDAEIAIKSHEKSEENKIPTKKISKKTARVKSKMSIISKNKRNSNEIQALEKELKNENLITKGSLTNNQITSNAQKKLAVESLDIFDENHSNTLSEVLKPKSQSCPIDETRCHVTRRKKLGDSPILKEVANIMLSSRKTMDETMLKQNNRDLQSSKENEMFEESSRSRRQRKPISYKLPQLNVKMRRP